jgi:hypothetical protein
MQEEYILVKDFVDADTCGQMVAKLDEFFSKKYSLPPDKQCTISPAFYGIFNDESINFLPRIENLVGKKLYPTYTYSRIYRPGEVLLPHTDRVECEYSFTLSLKYDKKIWPFYLQTASGIKEVFLDAGEMLIYKGTRDLHWRKPLLTGYSYQAFFHYVDQDGDFADKKYDGHEKFLSTQEALDELIRKRHVLQ